MYKIEKKNWGFKVTFDGFIKADEMHQWVEESKKLLQTQTGKFGIMVDMRTLLPLPSDAQKVIEEGQKLYKTKGMERSAVILNNVTTTMQFMRIAKETGIHTYERYLDASSVADWEKKATDWLASGVDPDVK